MKLFLYYSAAILFAIMLLISSTFVLLLGVILAPIVKASLPYGRDQITQTRDAWALISGADVKSMQQADAQEAMEAIAWRYYDCGGERDVYLLGSKDPDYVDMVFLTYDSNGNPLETEYYLGWDLQEGSRKAEDFVVGCRVVYSK